MNVDLSFLINHLSAEAPPRWVILDVRSPEELRAANIDAKNDQGIPIPKIDLPLEKILKLELTEIEKMKD